MNSQGDNIAEAQNKENVGDADEKHRKEKRLSGSSPSSVLSPASKMVPKKARRSEPVESKPTKFEDRLNKTISDHMGAAADDRSDSSARLSASSQFCNVGDWNISMGDSTCGDFSRSGTALNIKEEMENVTSGNMSTTYEGGRLATLFEEPIISAASHEAETMANVNGESPDSLRQISAECDTSREQMKMEAVLGQKDCDTLTGSPAAVFLSDEVEEALEKSAAELHVFQSTALVETMITYADEAEQEDKALLIRSGGGDSLQLSGLSDNVEAVKGFVDELIEIVSTEETQLSSDDFVGLEELLAEVPTGHEQLTSLPETMAEGPQSVVEETADGVHLNDTEVESTATLIEETSPYDVTKELHDRRKTVCLSKVDPPDTPEGLLQYARERIDDYSFIINEKFCETGEMCNNCFTMRVDLQKLTEKYSLLVKEGHDSAGSDETQIEERAAVEMELQSRCLMIESELTNCRAEREALLAEGTALREAMAKLELSEAHAKKDLEDYKFLADDNLMKLKAENRSLKNQVFELDEKCRNALETVKQESQALESLRIKFANDQRIGDLVEEVKTLKQIAEEFRSTCEEKKKKLSLAEEQAKFLTAERDSMIEDIRGARRSAELLMQKELETNEKLKLADDHMKQLENEAREANNRMGQMEREAKEATAKLLLANDSLKQLENKEEEMRRSVAQAEDRVRQTEKETAEMRRKLELSSERIKQLEDETREAVEKLDLANDRISQLEKEAQESSRKLDLAAERLRQQEQELAKLTTGPSTAGGSEATESLIADLQQRVQYLESEKERLAVACDNADAEAQDLRSENFSLRVKVGVLEGEKAGLSAEEIRKRIGVLDCDPRRDVVSESVTLLSTFDESMFNTKDDLGSEMTPTCTSKSHLAAERRVLADTHENVASFGAVNAGKADAEVFQSPVSEKAAADDAVKNESETSTAAASAVKASKKTPKKAKDSMANRSCQNS